MADSKILLWYILLLLSTVHTTTLPLNTCHLYYIYMRHRVSFTLPPSISSPNNNINITRASRGFDMRPFPLKSPSSSSQIYRYLHGLQIKSKNSPFLRCKHLWHLAIYIHVLQIRHNHVDFGVLKLYYVMLCTIIIMLSQSEVYLNITGVLLLLSV